MVKKTSKLEKIKAQFLYNIHLYCTSEDEKAELISEVKNRFEHIYKSISKIEGNIDEDDILTYTCYDAVEKSQCEHIAPNTENQDANSGYCPYDDEFRESYLNSLGNYLLLSGHHNESIGNTTFEAKRNTYTQLLQQQEIRNMTEQDHLWDKAKIDKRKELIVDFVMATF